MRSFVWMAVLCFTVTSPLAAAAPNVFGDWKEPGGAVIRVAPCGSDVCATILTVSPNAPAQVDARNPDPAQQTRSLCGLVIGRSFHLNGQERARDGLLYDPRSGKTYHGEMSAEGDELHLRGYIGMRMFGRTQTWMRTSGVSPCAP